MKYLTSYAKKVSKKIIFLSIASVALSVIALLIVAIVNRFELPNATLKNIAIYFSLLFSLPLFSCGIFIFPQLIMTRYKINKYLETSSKEKQQELKVLLDREIDDKEINWHWQPQFSEHFILLLPDILIDRDELLSCKNYGTTSYHRGGTYYQVKFILKDGRKKVVSFPTKAGSKETVRWWQQKSQ